MILMIIIIIINNCRYNMLNIYVGSHYDCDNDDVDDDLIMMAMMMMMMMAILIAAGRAAFFNNNFIDRVVQHLLHQLHLQ